MSIQKHVSRALETIIKRRAKVATVIVSDRLTVVVTRRFAANRRKQRNEFLLTIGRPNYRNLAFIKLAKQAGERFPIRNVLVRG